MKKAYMKPVVLTMCIHNESKLLTASSLTPGTQVSGTSGSHIEAGSRGGSSWDDED